MRDDKPNHRWLMMPRHIAIDGLTLSLVTVLSVAMIAIVSWLGPAAAAGRVVGAFR